jgi:hypothetical protein
MTFISKKSTDIQISTQHLEKFNIKPREVTKRSIIKVKLSKQDKFPKEPGHLVMEYSARTILNKLVGAETGFLRLAYVKNLPSGKVQVKIKGEDSIEFPKGTTDTQIKAYIAKTKIPFDLMSNDVKGFGSKFSFPTANGKTVNILTPVYSNMDLGFHTLDKNGRAVTLLDFGTGFNDDEFTKIHAALKKLYEEGRLSSCQYTIR